MTWLQTTGTRILLALVLSFALWVFVSFSQNPDRISDPFNIPTETRGLDSDLVIVDPDGLPRQDLPTADVRVQTDERTLSQLRPSDLTAFVDLAGLGAGEHVVPVEIDADSPFDRRIQVESVEPNTINIRLDPWITSVVPLRVDFEGNPPFSFERGNPRVDGKPVDEVEVQVFGPENRVKQVVIASATADIDQLSANYESSLQLQPLDANNQPVEGVEVAPATVNVEIPIRSVVGLKRIPVIGTIEGRPEPGYIITDVRTDPPLINLTGSSGPLDQVEQVATTPVNIAGATDTLTREVELLVPPGTLPQSGEPRQVTVMVQIERMEQNFQLQLPFPVNLIGVAPDLNASFDPLIVPVTVSGAAADFARLNTAVLEATVDVNGLEAGVYDVSPQIELPAGLNVEALPDVQVTLRPAVRATAVPPTPTTIPSPTPEPRPTSTPVDDAQQDEPPRTPTPPAVKTPTDADISPTEVPTEKTPSAGMDYSSEVPTTPTRTPEPTVEPSGITTWPSPAPWEKGRTASGATPTAPSEALPLPTSRSRSEREEIRHP